MRQILNMGTLLGIMAILMAGGCATTESGISDEEQIGAVLEEWKAAILAKNADELLATYSEDFSHDGYEYVAEDKAGLREYLEGSIAQGGFDDVEVSLVDAEIVIEEGVATVYPIDYTNWEGSIVIELVLTEEKAGWLITDMAIEGL